MSFASAKDLDSRSYRGKDFGVEVNLQADLMARIGKCEALKKAIESLTCTVKDSNPEAQQRINAARQKKVCDLRTEVDGVTTAMRHVLEEQGRKYRRRLCSVVRRMGKCPDMRSGVSSVTFMGDFGTSTEIVHAMNEYRDITGKDGERNDEGDESFSFLNDGEGRRANDLCEQLFCGEQLHPYVQKVLETLDLNVLDVSCGSSNAVEELEVRGTYLISRVSTMKGILGRMGVKNLDVLPIPRTAFSRDIDFDEYAEALSKCGGRRSGSKRGETCKLLYEYLIKKFSEGDSFVDFAGTRLGALLLRAFQRHERKTQAFARNALLLAKFSKYLHSLQFIEAMCHDLKYDLPQMDEEVGVYVLLDGSKAEHKTLLEKRFEEIATGVVYAAAAPSAPVLSGVRFGLPGTTVQGIESDIKDLEALIQELNTNIENTEPMISDLESETDLSESDKKDLEDLRKSINDWEKQKEFVQKSLLQKNEKLNEAQNIALTGSGKFKLAAKHISRDLRSKKEMSDARAAADTFKNSKLQVFLAEYDEKYAKLDAKYKVDESILRKTHDEKINLLYKQKKSKGQEVTEHDKKRIIDELNTELIKFHQKTRDEYNVFRHDLDKQIFNLTGETSEKYLESLKNKGELILDISLLPLPLVPLKLLKTEDLKQPLTSLPSKRSSAFVSLATANIAKDCIKTKIPDENKKLLLSFLYQASSHGASSILTEKKNELEKAAEKDTDLKQQLQDLGSDSLKQKAESENSLLKACYIVKLRDPNDPGSVEIKPMLSVSDPKESKCVIKVNSLDSFGKPNKAEVAKALKTATMKGFVKNKLYEAFGLSEADL